MIIHRLACALLAVTLTACSAITGQPTRGTSEPELPAIADLAGFEVKPQDVTSLPPGRRGLAYNAIPPCEVLDWPLIYSLTGSQFQYRDWYNDEHEMRGCSSVSGGQSTGEIIVAATRTDGPGPSPLYDSLVEDTKRMDIWEAYTGRRPDVVSECFWLRAYEDHAKNTGMACRDVNNVTTHFLVRNGISKTDSVKLMGVAIARARAYFEAYQR